VNPGKLTIHSPRASYYGSARTIENSGSRTHPSRSDSWLQQALFVSVVTARDAPAHERMVNTLKNWKVTIDDAFFLGGIEKGLIMQTLRPHIFLDDQRAHLEGTAKYVPSVHVPFGALNRIQPEIAPGS
jgi:5'-nucleotidase